MVTDFCSVIPLESKLNLASNLPFGDRLTVISLEKVGRSESIAAQAASSL